MYLYEVRNVLQSNGLPFSSRKRAAEPPAKMPAISRAKRSAATACWATPLPP
jgi:hypothetical protein